MIRDRKTVICLVEEGVTPEVADRALKIGTYLCRDVLTELAEFTAHLPDTVVPTARDWWQKNITAQLAVKSPAPRTTSMIYAYQLPRPK